MFEEVHPLRFENFTLYGRQSLSYLRISSRSSKENAIDRIADEDGAPLFARL
ncbi:hypothetical protein RGR602_PB00045 (plasmid) [Rhizobium gallicum bv. gallicum R602sp]|uniref:Uncharacterized protein n=1 Tax=Rhizobium gallicum bv. gallicum R602sp TaxID=1041138 RepID=A0A0B4X8V1_9HYPH|nr:hypothetical protein RGR602_PB00045 [Rhizobium gallicum bv. gallicum R602sp]